MKASYIPLFDRSQLCPHAIEGLIGNSDLPAVDFSKRVTEKSCDGDELAMSPRSPAMLLFGYPVAQEHIWTIP